MLALDAAEFGREMFEATSDVSEVSAEEIVARDAKRYQVQRRPAICIAQVEVVGEALLERKASCSRRCAERARPGAAPLRADGHRRPRKGTELLVAGDTAAVARAFGVDAEDSAIELPG